MAMSPAGKEAVCCVAVNPDHRGGPRPSSCIGRKGQKGLSAKMLFNLEQERRGLPAQTPSSDLGQRPLILTFLGSRGTLCWLLNAASFSKVQVTYHSTNRFVFPPNICTLISPRASSRCGVREAPPVTVTDA